MCCVCLCALCSVIAQWLQKVDPKTDGAARDWVAIYDECKARTFTRTRMHLRNRHDTPPDLRPAARTLSYARAERAVPGD